MASLKSILKQILPPIVVTLLTSKPGRPQRRDLPDRDLYQPLLCPWLGGPFTTLMDDIRPLTLVSPDRCWVLHSLARQARTLPGIFLEAGVYRGGTAMLLRRAIEETPNACTQLHLFDTFAGMPDTDPSRDFHRAGDFADTSIEAVRGRIGPDNFIHYHPGFIPNTFADIADEAISLAHIDVDIYRSVIDCCAFVYPRLVDGGFMVFDDYGFPSCPGARAAVDEFFAGHSEVPLVLPTGQAVIFKSRG
jgi:O-methyltransferase